jgi:hypothetical protein
MSFAFASASCALSFHARVSAQGVFDRVVPVVQADSQVCLFVAMPGTRPSPFASTSSNRLSDRAGASAPAGPHRSKAANAAHVSSATS